VFTVEENGAAQPDLIDADFPSRYSEHPEQQIVPRNTQRIEQADP
jgi:hypothetical protein